MGGFRKFHRNLWQDFTVPGFDRTPMNPGGSEDFARVQPTNFTRTGHIETWQCYSTNATNINYIKTPCFRACSGAKILDLKLNNAEHIPGIPITPLEHPSKEMTWFMTFLDRGNAISCSKSILGSHQLWSICGLLQHPPHRTGIIGTGPCNGPNTAPAMDINGHHLWLN